MENITHKSYRIYQLDENENITEDGTVTKKLSKNALQDIKDIKDMEMQHELKSFERLREFLLFILSECGKDIINGQIVNKLDDEKKPKLNPNSIPFTKPNEDDEETVKIPPEICKELCSTGYGKYSRFIPYLRANGVYDETTYNAFRTSSTENEWMPILGDIRKRYKKFCFKDIDAKENAEYYTKLEECEKAYEAINQSLDTILGDTIGDYTPDELKQVINKMDNKIPKMKFELFYPKKIDGCYGFSF